MPARQIPTRNLKTAALTKLFEKQAKQALKIAPKTALRTNMLLAGKRSANPLRAKTDVPRIKPSCTALVRSPIPDTPIFHALIRSGAAPLALNHSDVPNSCAIAIVATGLDRAIETGKLSCSFMSRHGAP